MMVAASIPPDNSCCCDVTISEHGTVPNEHCITAPITTCFGNVYLLLMVWQGYLGKQILIVTSRETTIN